MTEANEWKSRSIQQMAEKVKFLRKYEGMSVGDLRVELRLHKQRIAFLETG